MLHTIYTYENDTAILTEAAAAVVEVLGAVKGLTPSEQAASGARRRWVGRCENGPALD